MIVKSIEQVSSFLAGDLTRIREVLHPKNEKIDIPYSLAHGSLAVGASSLLHRLLGRVEVYIILEGETEAFIEQSSINLKKGDVLYVPAGAEQYLRNTGTIPVQFLCMVSPPWRKEEERITE